MESTSSKWARCVARAFDALPLASSPAGARHQCTYYPAPETNCLKARLGHSLRMPGNCSHEHHHQHA